MVLGYTTSVIIGVVFQTVVILRKTYNINYITT